MGASNKDPILVFIKQKLKFYHAALPEKANSNSVSCTSEMAKSENSGSLLLTGSNKCPSTRTEKDECLGSPIQREWVFLDEHPVPKKWVSQDNEESHPRPHHGQDFVETGKGVAELLRCVETSECQSDQLQTDCDQSQRDCRANLPVSQRDATVFQSPNDFEVAACWPRLQPIDTEDDGISPGMKESYANSESCCETEDSCDYSSGDDCLAVFQPMEKRLLQEDTNPFEKKNEDDATQVQKAHSSFHFQRLKELIVPKKLSESRSKKKQISKETFIITVDSDSEDEHVASSKMTKSSGLDNGGDPGRVEQKRQNHLLMDVIVIDSDTEDDSDQSIEKSTRESYLPSVSKDKTTLAISKQRDQMENRTSAGLQQSRSECQNTPEDTLKDKPEGACFDLLHGAQLTESKDVSDKVEKRIICSVILERTKNGPSSDSGYDSRQSTASSTKNKDQTRKTLPHETASAQPADFSTTGWKKTDVSENSPLRFFRNKKGEHLPKLKLGSPPKSRVQRNVEQQGTQSRHLSPTVGADLSISTRSSVPRSGGNSEGQSSLSADGSSKLEEPTTATNCNRKKLKRVTFAPELHSPLKRLARSFSAPSTSETSATPESSHHVISTKSLSPYPARKSSPRMKVREDWMKTHYPIRIGRKHYHGVEQTMETTNSTMETPNHASNADSDGPVRLALLQHSEAPRQRRRSQDSNTRLMKRCKNEAIVWSKAINRQPTQTKSKQILHFVYQYYINIR